MVYLASVISFLADTAGLLIMILHAGETERRLRDYLASAALILASFVLYLPPNVVTFGSFSIPLHILLVTAVNLLLIKRGLGLSVYLAIIFTAILNATRILFPLALWAARRVLPPETVIALSQVFMLAIAPIRFVILFLAARAIPAGKLSRISPLQWGTVVTLSGLIYFSKDIANDTLRKSAVEFDALLYPILIIVLSVASLAMFDSLLISQRERKQESLMKLDLEYRLKSLQTRNLAYEEVRQLYHDMKNHLLVLEKHSAEGQREYIRDLWSRIDNARTELSTGNETMNGLLEEALIRARAAEISMSVDADFSGLEGVSPVDLCSIFGNALDNAFEAAAQVPREAGPFIRVKSSRFANQLAVHISNSYVNALTSDGQTSLLHTTKADAAAHGIGMSSMQSAVARCGGSISYKASPEEGFSLFVMLPLKK